MKCFFPLIIFLSFLCLFSSALSMILKNSFLLKSSLEFKSRNYEDYSITFPSIAPISNFLENDNDIQLKNGTSVPPDTPNGNSDSEKNLEQPKGPMNSSIASNSTGQIPVSKPSEEDFHSTFNTNNLKKDPLPSDIDTPNVFRHEDIHVQNGVVHIDATLMIGKEYARANKANHQENTILRKKLK